MDDSELGELNVTDSQIDPIKLPNQVKGVTEMSIE